MFLAVSLDGFITREDDSLDWLTVGPPDPPEATGYTALMESADTMVVGRRTYDTVSSFPEWPFTGKRVVVLTHRPLESRHGESAYGGPLRALLEGLGEAGSHHIYLDGSQAVCQGLAAGVVTALTLTVAPVILGRGRPLFKTQRPRPGGPFERAAFLPAGWFNCHTCRSEHPAPGFGERHAFSGKGNPREKLARGLSSVIRPQACG